MQRGQEPSAVFVGKSRIPDTPGEDLRRQWEIIARHLSPLAVNVGRPLIRRDGPLVRLLLPPLRPSPLGAVLFYTGAPVAAVAWAAMRQSCAIVCKSPYEGLGVGLVRSLLPRRARPRLEIQVHGDWHTASTMYGSPARRLVAPLSDRAAAWALRHADRVRVVSESLGELVRRNGYVGPVDRYVEFSDYSAFLDEAPVPPPAEPRVAFVGVLERYKAVDVLLDSWVEVRRRVPGARLTLAGTGTKSAELQDRARANGLDGSVRFIGHVAREQVRTVIDESSCLVLPSRSEGLPRIVIESMARARPAVASTVGGMAELIDDGRSGRLVPPEDVDALTSALVDVLGDPAKAQAMGEEARRRAVERNPLAEYEDGIARLAAWISS